MNTKAIFSVHLIEGENIMSRLHPNDFPLCYCSLLYLTFEGNRVTPEQRIFQSIAKSVETCRYDIRIHTYSRPTFLESCD
mmetsp:Transcript_33660/g.44413  ORF Transcript_33660/g.44413 Transcript_33660/m.44413 type:complete len:80 (-) Transcript_33660:1892-2131(-)